MATDHTAGAPPSFGRTILANIGWNGEQQQRRDEQRRGVQQRRQPDGQSPAGRDLRYPIGSIGK